MTPAQLTILNRVEQDVNDPKPPKEAGTVADLIDMRRLAG